MRHLALGVVFLLVCPIGFAQMMHHGPAAHFPDDDLRISPCVKLLYFKPAVLQPEFQKVNWPGIRGKADAPLFFSQGMTQYYALNYEEAMRNFAGAQKTDKTMPMASWGIALAAGENINLTMTDACHLLAKREIACALSQAGRGPHKEGCERRGSITLLEGELIDALKKRYDYPVGDKKAALDHAEKYRDAMKDIWEKDQQDQNVGALYAESMMDVHPWDLYEKDGTPKPYTPPIVEVLEASLGKPPDAVGANHYYIHGVEGSTKPQEAKAEPSADLLQIRVPKSGHLVHMSSHIYLLLGKYETSLNANVKAVVNDVDQYGDVCRGTYETYTRNPACAQLYYGHYLSHNYFFGSVSATFAGQSKEAAKLACATSAHVERFLIYEPGLQRYMTAPLMTLVVNRSWDKILKYPEPPEECYRQPPFKEDSGCHIVRSIWHWARGMAWAAMGHADAASTAFDNMRNEEKKIQQQPPKTWGNNDAAKVLDIANWTLNARINWARKDKNTTFSSLISAFQAEDNLSYDEPPQWFTPAREALGGAYLQDRQYSNALGVFEEALKRHPASGRALYGKVRALQGLHAPQAEIDKIIKNEYCPAWQYADYTMTDDDLWPAMPGDAKSVEQITCAPREQKVSNPSGCTCPATKWPPVGVADLRVDKLECGN
jgi:tetratricopeptide (TPR) repeat protein